MTFNYLKLEKKILFDSILLIINRFEMHSDWPTNGITHVRIWDVGAAWCQIHTGVDLYDWTTLDTVVTQVFALYPSAKITYTIGGTPLWLADPTCVDDPANTNYAAW